MAFPTYHERFSVSCCHNLRPCGSVKQTFVLHISKFANVVYFNIFFASTQFTGICQKPFYKFRSSAIHFIWLVLNNGFTLVDMGDTTPSCHKWLLTGPWHDYLKQGTSFPLVLVVVVLYFFFCFFMEDLCLQANVFSKEVSITQYSLENHDRFCARM